MDENKVKQVRFVLRMIGTAAERAHPVAVQLCSICTNTAGQVLAWGTGLQPLHAASAQYLSRGLASRLSCRV